MATRLERLEQEAEQLEARLQQKKARLKQEKRQAETRRKIIVGSAALKLCENDPSLAAQLEAELSPRDRERVGPLAGHANSASSEIDGHARQEVFGRE